MSKRLISVAEVIDALGGPTETGRITGDTVQAVVMWRVRGNFAPATYVAITSALAKIGKTAPPSLWNMRESARAKAL